MCFLNRKGRLSVEQLTAIVEPLLDAVKLIHDSGHLHRDIKPANILISNEGQPVLLDFGSARRAVGKLSHPLSAIISAGYSPYEQYLEDTEIRQGPWTDIYALAATFYKCISGKTPTSSIDRKDYDSLRPISSLASGDYPDKLLKMIDEGLKVDMRQRPQTISEWEKESWNTPLPPPLPPINDYAGFWKRFAASFIDGIITLIGSFIILLIYALMMSANGANGLAIDLFLNMMAFFIGWFYYSVMESSPTQATLGKMALGIKVTDLERNKITFAKASGRYFGKTISAIILLIGFIMVAFTEKKQGLHDMMAGCLVINK